MKLKVMVTKQDDQASGSLVDIGFQTSKSILFALQMHGIEFGPDVLSVTLIPSDDGENAPLQRRTVIGRTRLIAAMERGGWIVAGAARVTGLTTRQVHYALKHYGITRRGISKQRAVCGDR